MRKGGENKNEKNLRDPKGKTAGNDVEEDIWSKRQEPETRGTQSSSQEASRQVGMGGEAWIDILWQSKPQQSIFLLCLCSIFNSYPGVRIMFPTKGSKYFMVKAGFKEYFL